MSTASHWDDAYRHGDTTRSWYQQRAESSLAVLDQLGVTPGDTVLDVGGGASTLVDALLARGYDDVTVLDVSTEGLRVAQARLGADAARVHWVEADLLAWQPRRTWDVWHDRAVLHFFAPIDRPHYLQTLDAATSAGSLAVLATFAPDGPTQCSGLPTQRYDAEGLATLLGARWELQMTARRIHVTPSGAEQPFTWAAFRRLA